MRLWLGVPTENLESSQVLQRLGLAPTRLVEAESLEFGKMFFCKLRVPPNELEEFRQGLSAFEVSEGRPRRPISFKLERPWWNVNNKADGKCWEKDSVTLWSPLKEPEVFYGVVSLGAAGEGDEVDTTKTDK